MPALWTSTKVALDEFADAENRGYVLPLLVVTATSVVVAAAVRHEPPSAVVAEALAFFGLESPDWYTDAVAWVQDPVHRNVFVVAATIVGMLASSSSRRHGPTRFGRGARLGWLLLLPVAEALPWTSIVGWATLGFLGVAALGLVRALFPSADIGPNSVATAPGVWFEEVPLWNRRFWVSRVVSNAVLFASEPLSCLGKLAGIFGGGYADEHTMDMVEALARDPDAPKRLEAERLATIERRRQAVERQWSERLARRPPLGGV